MEHRVAAVEDLLVDLLPAGLHHPVQLRVTRPADDRDRDDAEHSRPTRLDALRQQSARLSE
ncbi:hypothetical protein [Streptomyces sp. NPDC029674]|uniref:hypothetical protein n=1 Tax=Streptomyces sp. NPDC029674 TaxID=3365297 RepID=UPI00384C88CF